MGLVLVAMKHGKIWGQTELIHSNASLEFHRIDFRKQGLCSRHRHRHKWNGFYVISGRLLIRVWKDAYDLVDETILSQGEWTSVKPGEYHQFEALEDGSAFELYWAEFDHDDIERDGHGQLDTGQK